MEPLLRLIDAARRDQRTMRYHTFDELAEYCSLSANPVGELVLHVLTRPTPEQVALSDRICTARTLIEHLQGIARDRRRGRLYVALHDLERFGVDEADLDAPAAGPALRALVEFEAERAAAWLEAGAPLVSTLRGRARWPVSADIAAGRAALAALARAGYDPLPAAPVTDGWRVFAQWLGAGLRRAG
jgi:phytoene/squalene synthetase